MAEDEKQDSVPKMIHVSSFKIITWFYYFDKGKFEKRVPQGIMFFVIRFYALLIFCFAP